MKLISTIDGRMVVGSTATIAAFVYYLRNHAVEVRDGHVGDFKTVDLPMGQVWEWWECACREVGGGAREGRAPT